MSGYFGHINKLRVLGITIHSICAMTFNFGFRCLLSQLYSSNDTILDTILPLNSVESSLILYNFLHTIKNTES